MAETDPPVTDDGRVPVVVVDDLHVTYRVFASGKAAGNARSGVLNMTRGIREVHALKGVSFIAYENESIGVIGSNGSGKSTLMRALTGLTPPPPARSTLARAPICWAWVQPSCPTCLAPATSSSAGWRWASAVKRSPS